jgi:hypothetical protein
MVSAKFLVAHVLIVSQLHPCIRQCASPLHLKWAGLVLRFLIYLFRLNILAKDALQNTWTSFGCNLVADIILDTANKVVQYGFWDLGYEYIILDHCWSAGRNSSGYLMPNMTKFPNGTSGLSDKIHDLGMKIGTNSSAGTMTCARYGSLGYEQKDDDVWSSWGVGSHVQCCGYSLP